MKRRASKKLLGYVMLSTDITDTPAYSGKPVVTLIGMDRERSFRRRQGAQALRTDSAAGHSRIGPAASSTTSTSASRSRDKIEVGQSRPDEDVLGVDAISGATVTVIAQNQVMMASGTAVARQVGILEPTVRAAGALCGHRAALELGRSWSSKAACSACRCSPEQVGLVRDWRAVHRTVVWRPEPSRRRRQPARRQRLGQPARAPRGTASTRCSSSAAPGIESFKGSGFVRGGIYDRMQVKQGADAFTFRDLDYLNLYGLEAAGAPGLQRVGHLHHPLQGLLRRLSLEAELSWATAWTAPPARAASPASTASTGWRRNCWRAADPVVEEAAAPWVRIWKSTRCRDRSVCAAAADR